MKVLISGGSGFIGTCLTQYLLDKGCQVVILDRNRPRIASPVLIFFQVDLLKPELFDQNWFTGVDAIINLSGKNIFTFWTKKSKREIWESRVRVNKNLIDCIARLQEKPRVFVSASAVGYYGNQGETELVEGASHGQGFLAELCGAWEEEARQTEEWGLRSVQVRTAPVLDKSGGILGQIMKSFRFGLSFIFGSGNNWFPWIHMHDLVRIYYLATTNEAISGPINACAPYPVRFREFIDHLREFKKALVIPFPIWVLKLFLKETADVVLYSQKVVPSKLSKMNFSFSYPTLRDALKKIFSEE